MNSEASLGDCIHIEISADDCRKFSRLDQCLTSKVDHLSRTLIKKLLSAEMIASLAPEVVLTPSKMPPAGTLIEISVPPPPPSNAVPENIPLNILYQDEHLIFVDKPVGMVTHPAIGNHSGTLVNALLFHCPDMQRTESDTRPGIVHRLDKGTGGVMVVAKTRECHEELTLLFSQRNIQRLYEAVVIGNKLEQSGVIEAPIGRHPKDRIKMAANISGGKNAVTRYKVKQTFANASHLELKLETGRTHQIRVHLSSVLHAPIICDPLYGRPREHLKRLGCEILPILGNYPHPLLHACSLGLTHPITGEYLEFSSPVPEVFLKTLEILSK